jgi:hypothetical protein
MSMIASPLAADIAHTLDRFQSAAASTLAQLTTPYAKRAAADERAALGPPLPWGNIPVESNLRTLADLVLRSGGGAAPLLVVAEDDSQLDGLVVNYVAGLYDMKTASSWLKELKAFGEKIEADVAAARAALPRWERLLKDPGTAAQPDETMPDIVTPEQAVKMMGGSISVEGLRARIRKGQAGPWRHVGDKWQIRTATFLAWHRAQPGEAQEQARARGQVLEKLATKHPPRRKGNPSDGGRAAGPARG